MYDHSPYRNQNAYTMTVEGSGQITVKPDEAILTVGVKPQFLLSGSIKNSHS
ncbi:SIMPL domain-containing protein [Bacillus aerolatus]|uniref:SIMPL domain-containing protein n=1 Tax=Bacillus aerolatus TaxID=2653354 RepID=UPI001781EBF8|nr:SIMPL domain-containing protein [Bacillus aerolatus]